MSFFDPVFSVIFAPLLKMHPGIAICVISLLISLIIVFATKLFTDQKEMKRMKDQLKEYQNEVKANKDDAAKVMEAQKNAMRINMQYMKKSFTVTLITIIPIILVFGWLNAQFTYEPLSPGDEFVISLQAQKGVLGNVSVADAGGLEVVGDSSKQWHDGVAVFTFKGDAGDHLVTFSSGSSAVDKEVRISAEREYKPVQAPPKDDVFKKIEVGNKPWKIWGLSWFWIYLISAVVFSSLLRKVFKVY